VTLDILYKRSSKLCLHDVSQQRQLAVANNQLVVQLCSQAHQGNQVPAAEEKESLRLSAITAGASSPAAEDVAGGAILLMWVLCSKDPGAFI